MHDISEIAARWSKLRDGLDQVILGQDRVKRQVMISLLAGGHALLEGVPGTGKTLLCLALARLVGCRFRRIQFTPDLMPADLLGTNIFNQKSGEFAFRAGPLFTDILLADEINRTPPRTQSALLESMQERAATIDGTRYRASPVFTVFATQNPVEFEGTYPLPEAQRDRFLMKIDVGYPDAADEVRMLSSYAEGRSLHDEVVGALQPVLTGAELLEARKSITSLVRADAQIIRYIQEVVSSTRRDEAVQLGAGPRASLALMETSRAAAAMEGRDFITPDDVKSLAAPVLTHRVTLNPEAEMEGISLADVLNRVFDKVEVPR